MNLLLLIDSMEGGGAERACLNIAHNLCEQHSVTVAVLFDAEDPGYWMDPRIEYRRLHIVKHHALLRKPDIYCREIYRLRKLKKERHIDCCISFLETANFLNVLSCTGEKTIISIRNYYSRSLWQERIQFQKFKASYAAKHADRTVCVSRIIADDMMANFHTPQEKLCVIYNMYEPAATEMFPMEDKKERFQLYRQNASIAFLTAGRYVEQKGQWHLVRAFRKVVSQVPGARLFLFGKGPLEDLLKETIRKNGLEDHVYMIGFDSAIAYYMEHSDVYVCSSQWEGFSNSLLEAMACGLPVISTDCRSGPRELLSPDSDCRKEAQGVEYAEYGVLVPVCSGQKQTDVPLSAEEEYLAEAMITLAKNPVLRTGYRKKSLERMESFTPDTIMDQWEQVIEETVQG